MPILTPDQIPDAPAVPILFANEEKTIASYLSKTRPWTPDDQANGRYVGAFPSLDVERVGKHLEAVGWAVEISPTGQADNRSTIRVRKPVAS